MSNATPGAGNHGESPRGNVFAAIDIGTNSVRLAVVRLENGVPTTLAVHREVVRLGEGEFETNRMTRAAIERGALVCSRFADVARGFGADEIVALATSAVREAENREEFIERVRELANLEVSVISGMEEARLIFLGVSSGLDLGSRNAVLIDIGGGSTEVIVGNGDGYKMLDSMKLGAVRLSNQFTPTGGPVTPEGYDRIKNYVRGVATQPVRRVREQGFDLMMGSAGTITTLGDIIAKRYPQQPAGSQRIHTFSIQELRETAAFLSRLSLIERRKVPGMDAGRAEIIIAGSAIVLTLMEEFGAERLQVSDRGLRDGILLDYQLREKDARDKFKNLSVRRRSILQLARACNYEAEHSAHCAFLALRLFDELKRLGAHPYGDLERELLEYAALTHDIGMFLSHSNHQKHAYYLIRNSDLLGFTDTEIDLIANVALYHRKGIPKKRHTNLAELDRDERKCVNVLASMLRAAEGLDRSHLGLVRDIHLSATRKPKQYELSLVSENDCQLEIWGLQNSRDLFEFVFGAPLIIVPPAAASGAQPQAFITGE
jgi:exopolyphosphatase / guanosine-5'-triphosphate,3'-diphosphate pyrophosphatase